MSFQDLQQGFQDIRQARRENKADELARLKQENDLAVEQQKSAARKKMASTLSSSLEGQTTQGQLVSQGLEGGVITPESAISNTADLNGMKLFYKLQAQATQMMATDPAGAAKMMKALEPITNAFHNINATEAYMKSKQSTIGVLEAKSQFGVLHQGRGGGGGGRGGGNSNPGAMVGGDTEGTEVGLKFDNVYGELSEFIMNDDFGKTYMQLGEDKSKGINHITATPEDYRAFLPRLERKVDAIVSKNPAMNKPGMEAARMQVTKKIMERMLSTGLQSFAGTGVAGEKKFSQTTFETVNMPQAQAISLATQQKGTVKTNKKGNIKSVVIPMNSPGDGTGKVDTPKDADANYYLQ